MHMFVCTGALCGFQGVRLSVMNSMFSPVFADVAVLGLKAVLGATIPLAMFEACIQLTTPALTREPSCPAMPWSTIYLRLALVHVRKDTFRNEPK